MFGEPAFLCAIWRPSSMLHLVMNDDSKVYAHRFGSKIGINGLYTTTDNGTLNPDLYNIARKVSF